MRHIKVDNPGYTLVASGDESNPDWKAGVEAVVAIRCLEHKDVPPYNHAEPGECAACKVIPQCDLLDAAADRVGELADSCSNYLAMYEFMKDDMLRAGTISGFTTLRDTLKQLFFDLGGDPETWDEFDESKIDPDFLI